MASDQKKQRRGATLLLAIVGATLLIMAPSYMIWILESRIQVNLAILAAVGFALFVVGISALYKSIGEPTTEEGK